MVDETSPAVEEATELPEPLESPNTISAIPADAAASPLQFFQAFELLSYQATKLLSHQAVAIKTESTKK